MSKTDSSKEYSTDDDENKPLIKKVYLIIRSHWKAFGFALIIALITVVVVPTIYSLKHNGSQNSTTTYAWNISGITIINQSTLLNGRNQSLGLISALQIDLKQDLYLLDNTNNRIIKYSFQESNLTLIFGYLNGTNGSDLRSLNSPNDMVIDKLNNDSIYIADTFNHRILLWNQINQQGTNIFGTGQPGAGNTQLNNPMALEVVSSSIVYVADYGNNRILSFNLETNQTHTYLQQQQANADRNTYVLTPIAINFNVDSFVIAQQLGFNVIRWTTNSTTWNLIAGSASSELSGTSRTLFNQLCDVAVDDVKHTYVVDCYNERIQYFEQDLAKGRTIAGVIQAKGTNQYLLNQPNSIILDQNKNIYVADTNNFRIQKFTNI